MIDYKDTSDSDLVKKIVAGDHDLFENIMERYEAKIFRYVRSLIKDENKSADIVQETFIKSYVNLNSFNPELKFSSWLYRIAHNETINEIKKYKKEISLPDDFDIESGEDIEENLITKELGEHVTGCLTRLPVIYSEPLILFYLNEKSYEEISDILRIPMGTVAIRISRAKKLMKNICQTK